MKKTVIFGGTFNPIHLGHEAMLRAVAALPDTGEVWLMPDNKPPHKDTGNELASGSDRYNMCVLAAEGIKNVLVSDHELKKSGKSYTVDTLCELKSAYPDKEFAIVVGGDMLIGFDVCWYRYEDILKLASVIAFKRCGEDAAEFDLKLKKFRQMGADITVLDNDIPSVSSSEIRRRLRQGESTEGLLNRKIAEYINMRGLYRDGR